MKEAILSLESDFSNNEYYGTNVWTEEKYRILSGNTPVLLSAPHSVNQIRGDDVRNAERFTGAITRYLSNSSNSYAIFQLFTHADPNTDEIHNYKNAIINLIEAYNIKLLIDIHSSEFNDDTDIDIVTNKRKSLCNKESLIDKFKLLSIKHGVKVDENNSPNKEMDREIISVASLICGVPCIRLIINSKKLDIENNEIQFKKIILLLEEFISFFEQ